VTAYWLALLGAVVISMLGQTMLKAGAGLPTLILQLFDWRTLIGLFFYGFAALLYIVALRRIPMSVAMPCTAVSYVTAALIGHFWFAEAIGVPQIAGILLIILGVLLMAFRSYA
jgi:multidrug transporter EmrE-like cation transporter